MINPTKCVERILLNAPSELAVPLVDLMVWMADQPNLKDNGDYDEALNLAYSKLQDCRDARERYSNGRTN